MAQSIFQLSRCIYSVVVLVSSHACGVIVELSRKNHNQYKHPPKISMVRHIILYTEYLIIAAHKLLLTNVTNAITIAWNCVRKFKANADRADIIIQTADAGKMPK